MRKFPRNVLLAVTLLSMATPFGVAAAAPQSVNVAAAPALTPAQQMARMGMAQRVGQLFMVAANATGASAATMNTLANYHVGNVYLSGRSAGGTAATANVVRGMAATVNGTTTGNVRLLVATDQECGYVQVLSGPGFSTIPTGLSQGTWAPATLQSNAETWGRQLGAAGLNMNLAPVLDTVPSAAFAPSNAPIGYYEREYGYTPQTVSSHGNAFAAGMRQGNIVPVVKHFPGLGRVTLNTDTSSNVHDTATTRNDAYLQPFRDAINAGARVVMVSSAYYDRIDAANIAPFSPTIMAGMLRGDLGFTGVILSDDLCAARQLSPWSLQARAINFFQAGGSMLLCADPADIPVMYQAVLGTAQGSPAFAAAVNAAVLKVLTLKAATLGSAFGPGAPPLLKDFNGDGNADVMARNAAGQLWLYPGNGHSGWLVPRQVGSGWGGFDAVLGVGDFNGDGKADVMARNAAGQLWLYPGNGRGGWLSPLQVGSGWGGFDAVLGVGDFNGDGAADVMARNAVGQLWLYPGNGHGGWLAAMQVGSGWGGFDAVLGVGDFNGDGAADVMARNAVGQLWLYPGNGRGGWLSPLLVGSGWGGFNAVLGVGDFNGDGTADVMARNAAGQLWLYPGNGHGGWLATRQVGNGWGGFGLIF
ncbi:glycoside hydrolase family 3 N-terminal domain-containing protein [Arthrobacter sp. HY1533]|uniref:glycoside hydrolase family 3 N-terminal domain-containing protein n=1 Tax=Arthrobacter sp. HY1533 TaxID=2970919 RepID=UPI0022B9E1AF|nr:glycoside hydrolase family 3 N-terminal domain-containing protein [Arthrobacter sp. HY1533]